MRSKDWIFVGFWLAVTFFSEGAWARGAKNLSCKTRVLLTSQSEQEFLGETLELKILNDSLNKNYENLILKRSPLEEEPRIGELFTEDQRLDAELLMVRSVGVYDGPCRVILLRQQMKRGVVIGPQTTLAQLDVENCARGIAHAFVVSLEKNMPSCEMRNSKSNGRKF